VDLVARWWNGRWGRLGRRDIWLRRRTVWEVEARHGETDDGKSQRWEFTDDDEALAMIQRLMAAAPDDWKDLTGVSTGASKPQPPPTATAQMRRNPQPN
jgi:hypothetical protein